MESSLAFSLLLLLIAAVAAAWSAFDYFCAPRLSPNEPPLLPHPVPYIGHILGLLRHGTRYYQLTRSVALLFSLLERSSTQSYATQCKVQISHLHPEHAE